MPRRGWPAWLRASDIADLLRLSAPIAVSRAAMMFMSLTDAIVLGQMAPGELPFVLNSWLPMGIALGLGIGILMGVQVLTSELMGVGRAGESGRIFRQGVWVGIALGVALTVVILPLARPLFDGLGFAPDVAAATASCTRILALGLVGHMITHVCGVYLEALRRPMLVTVLMYGGVAVNAVIDLALVAGWWGVAPMGADGVAWATTGTRLFLVIVFLVIVATMTPAFRPAPRGPAGELKRLLGVGTGTAVSNVAEWGGFNFTFVIATWISLAANVVYGYAIQIVGVAFMLYLGIGSATSVRVAEAFGRRDPAGVQDAGRLGIAATLLAGLAIGFLILVLRDPIAAALIAADAEVEGVAIRPALIGLLWLVACLSVFDGLQATASMALRAQEIVWAPTAVHLGSFFLVMIPAGYWLGLVQGRGAQGMLEGAFIGVATAGILQVLLFEWRSARGPRLQTV